jgi:hypothetical protein
VVTAVVGGIVEACDVVVVQPATRPAKSRRQTILTLKKFQFLNRFGMIDQSFLNRICVV